jgi:hypothetical protein
MADVGVRDRRTCWRSVGGSENGNGFWEAKKAAGFHQFDAEIGLREPNPVFAPGKSLNSPAILVIESLRWAGLPLKRNSDGGGRQR